MSNRYEIEITVRRLSDDEVEALSRVVGLIPGGFVAVARMGAGYMAGWAIDHGATDAAARAAEKAIGERVRRGDLIVEDAVTDR
jgi:hypothetical protein